MNKSFFCRSAKKVGQDLIGCKLIKRNSDNSLLWGVIVETEAYSQEEEACHGFKNESLKNKTLFGEPGRLYVYMTYGKYFCVNIVTEKTNWASGVLLRSVAVPGENERVASGPGLLAMRFGLNKSHDNLSISVENGIWLTEPSNSAKMQKIIATNRIGISKAKELPWRWYMQSSRSISKRSKNDRIPSHVNAWRPSFHNS